MKPSEIFKKARKERRTILTEPESREVLKNYKIPLVEGEVVKSFEDADDFAEEVGYPLVLKIVSKDISHKTDVGGVVLDIKNEAELKSKMRDLIRNVKRKSPKSSIEGIFVQKMIKDERTTVSHLGNTSILKM